jgi:hypothetical protein
MRTFLLRVLLKIMWSVGGKADEVDGLPRLSGPAVEPLLRALLPGDFVLLGNNGLLTHVAVHVGDGEVIHAMATGKTMRGWLGSMWDAVKRLFGADDGRIGVVRESLPAFLERYERDTWVVVRHPSLTDDARMLGLTRVQGLVGKPYDYGFKTDNEAWYCTEIVDAFLRASLGDAAPALVPKRVKVPLLLDEDVIEPVAVLESPALTVVAANRAALTNYGPRLAGVPIS